jgi:hypothetical protein
MLYLNHKRPSMFIEIPFISKKFIKNLDKEKIEIFEDVKEDEESLHTLQLTNIDKLTNFTILKLVVLLPS